jgi:hypothetical protein
MADFTAADATGKTGSYFKAGNDIRMSKKEGKPKNSLKKPKYFRQNKSLVGSKLVVVSGAPMKIRNQWRGSDVASMNPRHNTGFNF